MTNKLLQLRDLSVGYRLDSRRMIEVVHDVSFDIEAGEIVGVVGESGSGKSSLGLAIPRLLPSNGTILGGQILFEGEDLRTTDRRRLRHIRGPRIAMIFQDPATSLNPTHRIGSQLIDVQRAHKGPSDGSRSGQLRKRAIEMLGKVGIPDPEERIGHYPHQLSGGMLQRVMIAMAALLNPLLLIADEPTSALDVTLQAQILRLLVTLRDETGTAVILITHDLGVVSHVCDRSVVMYAGRLVERASIANLFNRPLHPYTRGLLKALPSPERRGTRLTSIEGAPPRPTMLPPGCKFAPRCPFVADVCTKTEPDLLRVGSSDVRCYLYDDLAGHPTVVRHASPS